MSRPRHALAAVAVATLPAALGGCDGIQSALSPEGAEAGRIALIFWIMTAGGAAILLAVMVLTGLAISGGPRWRQRLAGEWIVIGGGLVFPAVTLSLLLAYGLFVMRQGESVEAAGADGFRIEVVGERWWWRVIYQTPGGERFESANELRIPVGRPVEIALTSADVIHSFWVPKLAGKLDMIPGRTNVLTIEAEQPGASRGQCAEYCGGAHALMSFHVVAMEIGEFEAWLAREAGAAAPPDAEAEAGRAIFMASGCPACHAIRGTEAAGTIGPDLTHLGGRMSLAAGTLPNDAASIARWITDNQHIKPENLMPPFGIFDDRELDALSSYLAGLR